MAHYVVKPRIVDLYEIIKVRPILLYHTYELTVAGVEEPFVAHDIGVPEVGDFINIDEVLRCLIKKSHMHNFKEAE